MDRRLTGKAAAVVACALAVLVSLPVWAGAPEEAAESMEEGAHLYQSQEYDAAAVAFRRAFELHGDARFLYNAARASHRGGNLEQAYRYYIGALNVERMALGESDAARAEAHARALEIRGKGQQVADSVALKEPQFDKVSWGAKGNSGIAIGAIGGLMLGASGVFAWRTSSRMGELENTRVDSYEEYMGQVVDIERQQRWGRRSLYGGGLLFGVGAGLVAWELLTVNEVPVGSASVGIDDSGIRAIWEVRFE